MTGPIPRILHQTWKTAEIPERWQACVDSWRRLHPGWEFRLWTDDDLLQLVRQGFPELLATYEAFEAQIQRVDMARLLILVRHGGVYADLDMECLRPVDPLLEGRTCVLVREPADHARAIGVPRLLGNAFIASVAGQGFLKRVAREMRATAPAGDACVDVLASTGPLHMQRVYDAAAPADVTLLDTDVAYPLLSQVTQRDLTALSLERMNLVRAECIARGAYAIHHWWNGWVSTLGGPLIGGGEEIEGFTYHPGVDSPGFDLAQHKRNVRALADACLAREDAAGFNTDGYLKSVIRERGEWVERTGDPGTGLYVRNAFHFGGGGVP